jgi:large subunit ribosomal protein L17
MFRNLATSLIEHERFETTIQKAKELRRVVEKLVTLALVDTVSNRRLALGYLTTKDSVHKLFSEIAPRFKNRSGGYTRVIRTRVRAGDAAEMGMIEFLKAEGAAATKSATSKGGAKKSSAKSAAKEAPSKEGEAKEVKAKAPRAAKKKASAE